MVRSTLNAGVCKALTAVLIAALSLTACGMKAIVFPPYRYRLNVEIDTPEGPKSGSSVIEVTMIMNGKTSLAPGGIYNVAKGQAVEVDLGSRGKVFAILSSGRNENWPGYVMKALSPWIVGADREDSVRKTYARILKQRTPIVLHGELTDRLGPARPALVRFADIKDPTSVQILDPDDLAASLGDGVKLRQMTVQITDAPITSGITATLPWLAWQRGALVPMPGVNDPEKIPAESHITESAFSRGIKIQH